MKIDAKQLQQWLQEYEKIVIVDVTLLKRLSQLKLENEKVVYAQEGQSEEIVDLYRTYEFSDRVIYVSKESNYGTLYNYVKTGVLSEEEFLDSIRG
jgi:hypothetical protein